MKRNYRFPRSFPPNIPVGLLILFSIFAGAFSAAADWDGAWKLHERQAPTREIITLTTFPDGRLTAVCDKTLHLWNGERWKKTPFAPSPLIGGTCFFADSRGRLYFLINGRLSVWDDGRITGFDGFTLTNPISAAEAPDGTILMGSYSYTDPGIFRFDGKTIERTSDMRVRSLTVDSKGDVWAAAIPAGGSVAELYRASSGKLVEITAEIVKILPVIDNNLLVFAAPDGSVWVTNENSYGVYRNGGWTFWKAGGIGGPAVLAFDRSGRVWGYARKTLFLYGSDGNWSVSRKYETTPNAAPGFLVAGNDTSVYSFDGFRVYRLESAGWEEIPDPNDLGSDMVSSVAFLPDGKLVCGHSPRGTPFELREGRGLSIFDGAGWKNVTSDGTNLFRNVFLLKSAPNGDIFVYSDDGYYFYDGIKADLLDSLKFFDATDALWENSGQMWITTNKGLVKFTDPSYILYVPPQILNLWGGLYNPCIDDEDNFYMQAIHGHVLFTDREDWYLRISDTGRTINDIAVAGDRTIWAARVGDLSWWEPSRELWFPVVDFPDSNRLAVIDPDGRIWCSSFGKTGYYQDGVFRDFPELAGSASDVITFSNDGKIALNAFNKPHTEYFGVLEYDPGPVKVEEQRSPVPFFPSAASPNPFNASTTISFSLPAPGRARITVYSVDGRKVKTLADRWFPAGPGRVRWDSSDGETGSGVYLYRIETGGKTAVGKMLLLK